MGVAERDLLTQLSLPPGFRFYPTDEELLVQYLCRKVAGHSFSLQIIGEIDLYKFDPWVLPSKAIFGEKEWYFFSPRDRKYPNGSRPNRVAGSGYWKATGTDKVITTHGRKVGIKKALVFYVGKAPKGTKTNWIMHEYRLSDPSRKSLSSKLDDWVLCRIYKKNSGAARPVETTTATTINEQSTGGTSSSSSPDLDNVLESLPEIDDRFFDLPRMNSLKTFTNQNQQQQPPPAKLLQTPQEDHRLGLINSYGSGCIDWSALAGLTSGPDLSSFGLGPAHEHEKVQQDRVSNEMCLVPSLPPLCHVDSPQGKFGGQWFLDEEVQSGRGTQQVGGTDRATASTAPGFFRQTMSGLSAQSYSNLVDPFRILLSSSGQTAGFGYGQ